MKRVALLFVASLSFFSFSSALAQNVEPTTPYLGPNITRTYYTDDLENSYGILTMGRDGLWTLTFPSPVVDVLYTKEGMVSAKIIGNSVMLAAIASSGKVPIAVILEGDRKQYFVVDFTASTGAGLRNIKITTRPAPSLQSGAQVATSNVVTGMPVAQAVQVQVPVAPPAPRPAVAPTPTPPSAPVASHLNGQFSATGSGTTYMVYYQIQNVSSAPYRMSEHQLVVNSQGQALLVRNAQDRTVMPGQWLSGTVKLQGPVSASVLNIEWAGQQMQTNAVTTLRTSVNVQQTAATGGSSR